MARSRSTRWLRFAHWWRQRLAPAAGRLRGWLGADAAGTGEGLPRAFVLFLVIFGVGMILISLIGDQGWIAYLRLQDETRQLRQGIEDARVREGQLRRDIRALRENPDYIELIARKQFGLVKPGEIVIDLVRKKPRED